MQYLSANENYSIEKFNDNFREIEQGLLPSVTSDGNGRFLGIINGKCVWREIPTSGGGTSERNSILTWIDVTEYGIKNDGTDNTVTLADLSVTDNCVLYFPRGTYVLAPSDITGHKNATLYMREASINLPGTYMLKSTDREGFCIEGGIIDGQGRAQTGIFTWGGTGTSGMADGTTYNWVAFWEE